MKTGQFYHIYINQNAGAVQNLGENALEAVLSESGLKIEALYILPPDQLFKKLKTEEPGHRILIGGGDGTITNAAEILNNLDIPFGIIPLGTMNLLAKDLKIPVQLNEAVRAYADETEAIAIDGLLTAIGFLFLAATVVAMPFLF